MFTVLIVLAVIGIVVMAVAIKASNQPKPSELIQRKCGCGKSQDVDAYCDGSHNTSSESKDNKDTVI